MGVTMVFEPRKTVSWDEFKTYPPHSIALDGYCMGGPRCTHDGLILNMNHHEDVDAVATRSTCEQALCHVKLGLFQTFAKDGRPHATLWLNDADQDAALATFVLSNPHLIRRPMLQRLVDLEDHMDMSAGLYPPDRCDGRLMRQLAWIFEPYTDSRLGGRLRQLDGNGMHALVTDIHRRIRATLFGRGKELALNKEFETLSENTGWRFVREIGAQARTGMAERGVRAYVVLKAEHEGRRDYSVGRLSSIVPFPLPLIFAALNEAEGIGEDEIDRWGGSRIVGGSPRQRGSGLAPDEITAVIEECIRIRQMGGRKADAAPGANDAST